MRQRTVATLSAIIVVLATVSFGTHTGGIANAEETTVCTRVLGGSQTTDWYADGNFESLVVAREWERQSRGGQKIADWAVDGSGWDTRVWSACGQDANNGTPFLPVNHVVLHALPEHGDILVDDVIQELEDAIAGIHSELPEATSITVMPPIGGDCPGVGLADQNPTVAAAINAVVGGDVFVGPNLIVPDCAYFSDNAGHLSPDGASWAAAEVASWFDSGDPVDPPPVADAGNDQVVVLADGATTADVVLDGSGSSDDSAIVDYVWTEDTNQIATGVTATVTFAAGVHDVTLTVTDDIGQTGTDTVRISVHEPSSGAIHVGDLDGSSYRVGKSWVADVTITVLGDGLPVVGATVDGDWVGNTGATSCITDGAGQCTVSSDEYGRRTTTLDFTVTSVTASGATYDPLLNTDPDGDSDGTTITVVQP